MASIPNSVPLTGPIAPLDDTDNYATHYAKYGVGGCYSVADYAALSTIPSSRLGNGEPLVYVIDPGSWYLYLNGSWVEVLTGGGGGASNRIYNGDSEVSIPNADGDITGKIDLNDYLAITPTNIFLGPWSGEDTVETFATGQDRVYYYANGGHNNVFIGVEAGRYNTTGVSNVFLGTYSGWGNFTGARNVFIGDGSGYNNTTGTDNLFLGTSAGVNNTTGSQNIFLGTNAGRTNTTTSGQIAIGPAALYNAQTGSQNIAIGESSLVSFVSGSHNISIGYRSLESIVLGSCNVALGSSAFGLTSNQPLSNNTAIGYSAGLGVLTGNNWTCLGAFSAAPGGSAVYTGSNNTCLGSGALPSSNSISNEVTIGNTDIARFRIPGLPFTLEKATMSAATNGQVLVYDSALGIWKPGSAGGGGEPYRIINGTSNVSINNINSDITFQRANSKSGIVDNSNVFLGYLSNISLTTGANNTAVGYLAGCNVATQTDNCFFGSSAGRGFTGSRNVGIGAGALFGSNPENLGDDNIALGTGSLGSLVSGSNNIGIGTGAGLINDGGNTNLLTGSNNITIGYYARTATANDSNVITLGNTNHTALRCAVTSITSLSDLRDKTNVSPLTLGLDFVKSLNPITFQWDKREWYEDEVSDGTKVQPEKRAGFGAQDLLQVQQQYNAECLNLVYESNPDKLEATYGNLIPVLVKAIQDLSAQVEDLTNQVKELQNA